MTIQSTTAKSNNNQPKELKKMTPTTFKKYKEQAAELEQRVIYPTNQTSSSLGHLEKAYYKSIRGQISKITDKSYRFNVDLDYHPAEEHDVVNDNGDLEFKPWSDQAGKGYWSVCMEYEISTRYYETLDTSEGVRERSESMTAKIKHYYRFTNIEELLEQTAVAVNFLMGFYLRNDQRAVPHFGKY